VETRRGLLKKTLGGAALLAAAGAVPLAFRQTRLREPRGPLRFFAPAEYSVFAAVADRILARGPADVPPELASQRRPVAPTAAELDVAGKADAFLAPLDEASAKDLKQLLALFDNALFSVLTGGPARPFTQMTPEQQDAHLERWATSRLAVRRTGFQALKRLAAAIYYSSPLSYASVGYPGPPYELVRTVNASRRRP
jgi:gluconate 2-dehydrogenase subunit 3-like protein